MTLYGVSVIHVLVFRFLSKFCIEGIIQERGGFEGWFINTDRQDGGP